MQVTHSEKDGSYNFIHDNGMQTSIKVSPSGSFTPEQMDRDNPITTNKNKYTIIISSSLGCQMSCNFCHLTKNEKPFSELSVDDIVESVLESVLHIHEKEVLCTKYVKLCFMGEGEPILDMDKTSAVATDLLRILVNNELCEGVDGVDIATCMPKVSRSKLLKVDALNDVLDEYDFNLNPYNHTDHDRTVVRLFYSLHHYSQFEREKIVPNTHTIVRSLDLLDGLDVNVVVHYMFMSEVNDSEKDLKDLVSFVNTTPQFRDYEFRVLRYNSHDNLLDMESERMSNIVSYISKNLNVRKFKVQYSAGEDIKAACGMFI